MAFRVDMIELPTPFYPSCGRSKSIRESSASRSLPKPGRPQYRRLLLGVRKIADQHDRRLLLARHAFDLLEELKSRGMVGVQDAVDQN